MAYGEAAVGCFRDIAAFTCHSDARAYLNGYAYERVPLESPEELQRRRDAYHARGQAALDAGSDLWEAEIRPEVESILRDLRRRRPRTEALPKLVTHVERCMTAGAHVMGDLHWRMAFGIPGDWTAEYVALTGGTASEAAEFLQGLDHTTSRLLRRLRHVAALHRDADPSFDAELAELLRRFGTRTGRGYGSANGFCDVTWSMDPSAVLDLIAQYARADLDLLEQKEREARASRQRAMRRLRRRFVATDTWPKLERAHRAAVARARAMENHNHLMEQDTEGLLRLAVHRLGTALVAAGAFDAPDDVFHFHVGELRALAADPHDVRAIVHDRIAEVAVQATLDPPPFVGAVPDGPMGIADPGEHAALAEPPSGEVPGTGASPGVVTGRARVVASGVAFPDVDQGDILVTSDAGPAWTPIFALLGGLVLDSGWTIQHAAIVCRELGIPCVLGTGTATTRIADGTMITVDGDAGVVRLVR